MKTNYVSKWWEKYKTEKIADQPNILKLVKLIDALEQNRSREAIDAIRAKIIAGDLSEYHKDNLERRLRLFDNRVNREVNEDFGAYVRNRRLQLGLSLQKVGDIVNVTAGYINRIEKGYRLVLAPRVLEGLAVALDTDFTSLLSIAYKKVKANSVPELLEFLYIGDFAIMGVLADRETKDAMSNMLISVFESKWAENTKHMDTLKIFEHVNTFKSLLERKNQDIRRNHE